LTHPYDQLSSVLLVELPMRILMPVERAFVNSQRFALLDLNFALRLVSRALGNATGSVFPRRDHKLVGSGLARPAG
jgi:hypothetical protein